MAQSKANTNQIKQGKTVSNAEMIDKENELEKKKRVATRITRVRQELLNTNPFFGELILQMPIAFANCGTAMTDMHRIIFDPDFADDLSDEALKFVLMHEVMHCVLKHCTRGKELIPLIYNIACDIVVNSNIMYVMNIRSIDVAGEEPMHKAPDGVEGYNYNAEEVYQMLIKEAEEQLGPGLPGSKGDSMNSDDINNSGTGDVGNKSNSKNSSDSEDGEDDTDYAEGKKSKDKKENDAEDGAGNSNYPGANKKNSNTSIQAPGKKKNPGNGVNNQNNKNSSSSNAKTKNKGNNIFNGNAKTLDNHVIWQKIDDPELEESEWEGRFREGMGKSYGNESMPPAIQQIKRDELYLSKLRWKNILRNFISMNHESNDYNFNPPDRRFTDRDYLLPGYNEIEEEAYEKLWFCVDTSGSVSDRELQIVYGEIESAIKELSHLSGWISFFDTGITEPKEFSTVESLYDMKAVGRGGTDFGVIFRALQEHLKGDEKEPIGIIILTDGLAPFPKQDEACGIPVLWVIIKSEYEIQVPWGEVVMLEPFDDI